MDESGEKHLRYNIEVFWTNGGDEKLQTTREGDFRVHFESGFELDVSSGMRVGLENKGQGSPAPEELFIASVCSCVMLSYIELAKSNDLLVKRYLDEAKGILARNEDGRLVIEEIQLFPRVTLSNSYSQEKKMIAVRLFHEARYDCFILSTVNSRVEVTPLLIFES